MQCAFEGCVWHSKITGMSFSLLTTLQVDATTASLYSVLFLLPRVRALAHVWAISFGSQKACKAHFSLCASFINCWSCSLKMWDWLICRGGHCGAGWGGVAAQVLGSGWLVGPLCPERKEAFMQHILPWIQLLPPVEGEWPKRFWGSFWGEVQVGISQAFFPHRVSLWLWGVSSSTTQWDTQLVSLHAGNGPAWAGVCLPALHMEVTVLDATALTCLPARNPHWIPAASHFWGPAVYSSRGLGALPK